MIAAAAALHRAAASSELRAGLIMGGTDLGTWINGVRAAGFRSQNRMAVPRRYE
jgi:hypothetical protein